MGQGIEEVIDLLGRKKEWWNHGKLLKSWVSVLVGGGEVNHEHDDRHRIGIICGERKWTHKKNSI